MRISTKRFRVEENARVRLKDWPTETKRGYSSKDDYKERLAAQVQQLEALQDVMYADNRYALLLIFQAMDAAGKDGVIKHVMSGINPQGCQVFSFKAPTSEELDHDYLWRCLRNLPERGRIGIFNRSYYEETLVVRVHPAILARQQLPPELVTKDIWKERFQDIRAVERFLSRNGVLVRKFFLHVSKKEQKRRFLERIDHPEKNWKFSLADVAERDHFDEYMEAYEDAIRETASEDAPWFVVPADNKWFTRLIVGAAVVDALTSLKLAYPTLGPDKLAELRAARERLTGANGKS